MRMRIPLLQNFSCQKRALISRSHSRKDRGMSEIRDEEVTAGVPPAHELAQGLVQKVGEAPAGFLEIVSDDLGRPIVVGGASYGLFLVREAGGDDTVFFLE